MPNPDTIPNLLSWWQADSLALAEGAAIASLADSGPNAYTATQGTAGARPLFRTNVINGMPVMRFDGVDDFLTTVCPTAQAAQTIVAVLAPTTATGIRTVRGGDIQTTNNSRKPTTYKNSVGLIGAATTVLAAAVFEVTTFAYSDTANRWDWYSGGAADGGASTTVAAGTARNAAIGRAGTTQAQEYFAGDLAELICYSSVLTATERGDVHSYIQDKYAIPVADYVPPPAAAQVGAFLPFFAP